MRPDLRGRGSPGGVTADKVSVSGRTSEPYKTRAPALRKYRFIYGIGTKPGDPGELLLSDPAPPGPLVADYVRETSVMVTVAAGAVGSLLTGRGSGRGRAIVAPAPDFSHGDVLSGSQGTCSMGVLRFQESGAERTEAKV